MFDTYIPRYLQIHPIAYHISDGKYSTNTQLQPLTIVLHFCALNLPIAVTSSELRPATGTVVHLSSNCKSMEDREQWMIEITSYIMCIYYEETFM